MVRPAGIEPTTLGFGDRYSNPTELRALIVQSTLTRLILRAPSLANIWSKANITHHNACFFDKIHSVTIPAW